MFVVGMKKRSARLSEDKEKMGFRRH